MKRLSFVLAIVASLAFVGSALAAPPSTAPGKNPLTCFADAPATCTTNGKTATIDTSTVGGDAGVYLQGFNASFYGVLVGQVTKLSNTVTGSALGIDPRWSIPIDTDHNGGEDLFAFVAFGSCNNGAGLVDVINDATCTISYGSNSYPNWTAYVTAHPTDRISFDVNPAFIIADGSGAPGVWTISNVQVGKPGK